MIALGMQLGQSPACSGTVFLQGEMGAGKTTLVRGLLRGKGYMGIVKSPTYALMMSYHLTTGLCYHLDLYRLSTRGEAEFPGFRDLFTGPALILIEWPDCVSDWLLPDLCLQVCYDGADRRRMTLQACTQTGNNLLCGLSV